MCVSVCVFCLLVIFVCLCVCVRHWYNVYSCLVSACVYVFVHGCVMLCVVRFMWCGFSYTGVIARFS